MPFSLQRNDITRVDADASLTLEQKNAAFVAITDETQRAFKETLGEKAYKLTNRK